MLNIKTFILQCFYVYGWVYLLLTIVGTIIAGIAVIRLVSFICKCDGSKRIVFILLKMFFRNFAVAAFITAGVSLFTAKMSILICVFLVFSFLSFAFLEPLPLRRKTKENEIGINDK